MGTRFSSALAAAVVCCGLGCEGGSAAAGSLRVFGTELRLTQADGSVLAGAELAGRTLSFDLPGGQAVRLRIDTVIRDPQDPRGEILLYRFLREDPADGVWRPLCPPAPDGLPVGFALRGAWDAGGRYRSGADDITLVCASGAIGKCLRMGYRLWGEAADGTPLHLFHQACTRAMRADYCGDGTSHTRDGTPIRIGDRLGLLDAAEAPDAVFEGLWGPDGALCLARPRLADAESLEDLVAACPRLEGRIGQACRAAQFAETPAALLLSYGAADPMR